MMLGFGFKSEAAGRSRAKAGVMRRLSMVALRSAARHVLRGLAVVAPPCIHQHNAREAARRAHHDAFGANRGAPWRNTTEGGGQGPRGGEVWARVFVVLWYMCRKGLQGLFVLAHSNVVSSQK